MGYKSFEGRCGVGPLDLQQEQSTAALARRHRGAVQRDGCARACARLSVGRPFKVDGTLTQAWAEHKSFAHKDK